MEKHGKVIIGQTRADTGKPCVGVRTDGEPVDASRRPEKQATLKSLAQSFNSAQPQPK